MNTIKDINWSVGNGLKFDGVNDYVDCGNILNFEYNQAFSINLSILFKSFTTSAIAVQRIISKMLINDKGYSINSNVDGKLIFSVRTNLNNRKGLFTNSNLNLNQLYNITFTKGISVEPNTYNVYVNGVNDNGDTLNEGSINSSIISTQPFLISSFANINSGFFNGDIFDIKVFNKELTQVEVTKLYHTQGQNIPSTAVSNCVADWTFNDKQGTALTDKSGNNYNGILIGYADGTTNLGATNSWIDKYGNPITQY
jgi:hypothetical protein